MSIPFNIPPATGREPEYLAQAIANHLTPAQLLRAMRPHPTFAEAMTDALENLAEKLTD